VIGPERLSGRSEIELVLERGAFVDVEAALEAAHRADYHVASGEWAEAWGPAGVAYRVASRLLLQGHDRPWLDEWRRRLDDVAVRGLECLATARLGMGGPALPQAETAARRVVELAPYRETGHQLLMEALAARANTAEALLGPEAGRRQLSIESGRDMFGRIRRNRSRRQWQELAGTAQSVYARLKGAGAREAIDLVSNDKRVQRDLARAVRLVAGRGPGGKLRGRAAGVGVTVALSLLRNRKRRR
jgi:DNA-binding SARP family transcriptional activator